MKTRILTAAVALPLLFAAILLPWYIPETVWVFVGIAVLALGAGLFEFFSLTKKMELKADAGIAYIGSAIFVFMFTVDAPTKAPEFLVLTAALFVIAVLVSQTFRFQADFTKMLAGIGVTLLGVFYLAFLGGFLIAMRVGFETLPGMSTKLLLFFFIVIFAEEKLHYFVGVFTVIKRRCERLNDRCGTVEGPRVAPTFEIMLCGDMPVAILRRLIGVSTQMNAKRDRF